MVNAGDYVALEGKGWGNREGEIVRVSQVCPLVYTAEGYYPDIYVEGIPGEILGPYPNAVIPPSFSYAPIGLIHKALLAPKSATSNVHQLTVPKSIPVRLVETMAPEPLKGPETTLRLHPDDITLIVTTVLTKLKERL